MKIKEIYDLLNDISPFELQENWDNSGLIIGSFDSNIERVVLSIDIDTKLIDKYEENTLFIIHHPLIFKGIRELDFIKYPSNLIQKLILKKQFLIAMHTNFDKTHLNRYVFEKILNLKIYKEKEFICEDIRVFNSYDLVNKIKKAFNLKTLRVVNFKEEIKGVALTTGAGASLMDEVSVDCFITGDIKYHDAIKAINQNLMLIEVGHYESERFFANVLANSLETLPISVIITEIKNPFRIL